MIAIPKLQNYGSRHHGLYLKHNTHPFTAYNPPSHVLEVIVIIFIVSDSWGLFTLNIFPGKKYDSGSLIGDVKVRPSDLITSDSLTLNINNFLVFNNRY